MTESRHIRFPEWAEAMVKQYQEQQKITTATMAILHLIKYGHQEYSLITNQAEIAVADSTMRTLADSLTAEQKQYLLKILVEQIGDEKVERIRQRVRESKP